MICEFEFRRLDSDVNSNRPQTQIRRSSSEPQSTVEEPPFKGSVKTSLKMGFSPRVPFSFRIPRRHPDHLNQPARRAEHQPDNTDPIPM